MYGCVCGGVGVCVCVQSRMHFRVMIAIILNYFFFDLVKAKPILYIIELQKCHNTYFFSGGGGGGGRRRFITKSANNYKTVHYLQKAETQTSERTIQ